MISAVWPERSTFTHTQVCERCGGEGRCPTNIVLANSNDEAERILGAALERCPDCNGLGLEPR